MHFKTAPRNWFSNSVLGRHLLLKSLARFDFWYQDFILILFKTKLVFLLTLYRPDTAGKG